MDYIDLTGDQKNAEGGVLFSFGSKVSEEKYNKGKTVNLCEASPRVSVSNLDESLSAVKRIVASRPPFIAGSECKWMLAYIDKIAKHISENYKKVDETHYSHLELIGQPLFEMACQFAEDTDAISATRMFFTMDAMFNIASNTELDGHNYFLSDGHILEFLDKEIISCFLGSPIYYSPAVDSQDYSKSFKTKMTRHVYKDTRVIVQIPENEEMYANGHSGKSMILNSGASFVGNIVRFYKTDLCWANRATFEFYPRMIGKERPRLKQEPMLAMEMEMAQGVASSMGYGTTINAFIPLHWVSHIDIEGKFRYVRDTPIASDGKSENLPSTITMDQFNEYMRT